MNLPKLFQRLRCDPVHALGLGDIRLTIAQQDTLVAAFDALKNSLPKPRCSFLNYQAQQCRFDKGHFGLCNFPSKDKRES